MIRLQHYTQKMVIRLISSSQQTHQNNFLYFWPMVIQVSAGVIVSVKTKFEPAYSNSQKNQFLFSYKIKIENTNEYSVQLTHRHWHIFDSDGTTQEVKGEGVVGEQPILEEGESYEYESGCNLKTSIGRMWGTYRFIRLMDESEFVVQIPAFTLMAPEKMN